MKKLIFALATSHKSKREIVCEAVALAREAGILKEQAGPECALADPREPLLLWWAIEAQCGKERSRGIDAAIRLADLLNGGKITIGRAFHDDYGREVRKVAVDGDDVGNAMIDAGVAREFDGSKPEWCATSDDDSDSE